MKTTTRRRNQHRQSHVGDSGQCKDDERSDNPLSDICYRGLILDRALRRRRVFLSKTGCHHEGCFIWTRFKGRGDVAEAKSDIGYPISDLRVLHLKTPRCCPRGDAVLRRKMPRWRRSASRSFPRKRESSLRAKAGSPPSRGRAELPEPCGTDRRPLLGGLDPNGLDVEILFHVLETG